MLNTFSRYWIDILDIILYYICTCHNVNVSSNINRIYIRKYMCDAMLNLDFVDARRLKIIQNLTEICWLILFFQVV